MADDPRAVLARIRERAEGATLGPWKLWGMDVTADPVGNSDLDDAIDVASTHMAIDGRPRTFDAEFIAHARTDVPRMARALEAVLDLHKADHDGRCIEDVEDYPCPTVRAITDALTTEETKP